MLPYTYIYIWIVEKKNHRLTAVGAERNKIHDDIERVKNGNDYETKRRKKINKRNFSPRTRCGGGVSNTAKLHRPSYPVHRTSLCLSIVFTVPSDISVVIQFFIRVPKSHMELITYGPMIGKFVVENNSFIVDNYETHDGTLGFLFL